MEEFVEKPFQVRWAYFIVERVLFALKATFQLKVSTWATHSNQIVKYFTRIYVDLM